MRIALTVLLLVMLSGLSQAGEGDDPLARLGAEEPSEVAWGAHVAGAQGRTDAIPALMCVLRRRPEDTSDEWKRVVLHALDALIRLDAHVEVDAIPKPVLASHKTESLILLGREPEVHGALLNKWFASGWAKKYFLVTKFDIAIGNLLATHPAPGFVAELLRRMPLTLVIDVRDPDDTRERGRRRNLRAGVGHGRGRIPEGFPPHVRWKLTLREQPDAAPFADGPTRVWSVRREIEEGGGFGESSGTQDSGPQCDGWLAIVLDGDAERVVLDRFCVERIAWADTDAYVSQAVAARDGFVREWHDLVRRCLAEGRLTREEALAVGDPHLEIEVNDLRADKSPPLPELPATKTSFHLPERDAPAADDDGPERDSSDD